MKKTLLLSVAAVAALSASAEYAPGTAAIVGDANKGKYKFEIVWGSDALVGNGNIRAGIGYADKFYFADNVNNNVPVYGKKGLETTLKTPGNVWVSATADDAGHVMIRSTTNAKWPSSGQYAGAYYPEDGHILTIIDGATGEILNETVKMDDGKAGRFDALGHVNGNAADGWWELIGTSDAGLFNDFMYDGIEDGCEIGTEFFPATVHKAFANSGAGAAKTTGSAQIFGAPDTDGNYTNMAVYCNPVVNITGSICPLGIGNGIQLYQYNEDEDGVSAWRATEKFIITPQHASNNGFVIFRLHGVDFIAYTSGESAPGTIDATAMAIAKVQYADTPVNGANDTDVLVARLYPNEEAAYIPGSMFTCFNVEYIPEDPHSVYLYHFCQGAPMIKTKFTVPADLEAEVADIFADSENAPVEYYNLQGVRVANPENGLFIKKQGNNVVKVIR